MSSSRADLPAELTQGPMVVEAWAPRCASCRAQSHHVRRAATASGVPVFDIRADDHPVLIETLDVRSVPTLIGFHDGVEVARLTGAQPARNVEALFTTTKAGRGTITNRRPLMLVAWRAGAGAVLAAAGLALDSLVLVAVAASVMAWAIAGLARRAA